MGGEFNRYPRTRTWGNSDLGINWTITGSDFSDYLGDFRRADSENTLSSLLERLNRKPQTVIIDLMSSTEALRNLHEHWLPSTMIKGLAVRFNDLRPEAVKQLDESLGISCIPGDLNQTKTWKQIQEWLGDCKADLIMERGFGGLRYIPTYFPYHRAILARLWRMLTPEGGTLLLQTPPEDILETRRTPIRKWLNLLDQSGIEYEFCSSYLSRDQEVRYGILRLIKNPEANTLPAPQKDRVVA